MMNINTVDDEGRRRKVRCPCCTTILVEPLNAEVYECPICSIILQAKRKSSKTRKKLLEKSSNEYDGETTGQNPLNNNGAEDHMPIKESIRQQGQTAQQDETVSVLESLGKEKSMLHQFSAISVAVMNAGEIASSDSISIKQEDTGIRLEKSVNSNGKDLNSGSKEIECVNEAEISMDCVMEQNCVDEKPETQSFSQSETFGGEPIDDGCLMAEKVKSENDKEERTLGIDTGTQRNDASWKCAGVEEPFQESNSSNEKNDIQSESRIIRDNDYELSFKYIASPLKSSVRPEGKKKLHLLAKLPSEVSGSKQEVKTRHSPSLKVPFSNKEGSDDLERYSSYSESPSHGDSDSEFDFPSPSVERIDVTKQSDSYFKGQLSNIPHQLEWQDADANNCSMIGRDQESNNSSVSGIEIIGKIASATGVQAGLRGKEIAEDRLLVRQDLIVAKALNDPKTTAGVFSHVQSDNFFPVKGLIEERFAHESGVSVSSTTSLSIGCDNIDSLNNCEEKICSNADNKLLESSGTIGDQNVRLRPSSIVRGDPQFMDADPSVGILSSTSQMEACLTVQDATSIKSVSKLALNGSTSRLHDNVVDPSAIVKEGGQAALPGVACGSSTANDHSDLRKEHKSDGEQMPYTSEQLRMSQNFCKSECHYAWDHTQHEKGQLSRIEVAEVSDPRLSCKRIYSSYAEQPLTSKDERNGQHQENVHDADLYPPSRWILEGSFSPHEGRAQSDSIPAGSSLHAQGSQGDLYTIGQTIDNVDVVSSFAPSLSSSGSKTSFDGSRSSGNTACFHQAPRHPSVLPVASHGHSYSQDIYHTVCPVCIPHFHLQDSVLPHCPVPSCLHCLRTMGHCQRHPELRHYHCGFQAAGSCMLCHSSRGISPQMARTHDTSPIVVKASRSSVKKSKKYPPLPQDRMAPYVLCRRCNDILQVPVCISSSDGVQRLRCGACGKVSKFSASENIQKSSIAGLQPSAECSASKLSSAGSLKLIAKRREHTSADLGQRIEPSFGKSFLAQSKKGSVSSRHLAGGRHNSQGEVTFEVKPDQEMNNAKLQPARNNFSSQDEFFFKSLSKKSEFGSSRSLFSGFKNSSLRNGSNNAVDHDEGTGNGGTSLQCVVDEKEEGLDFGAPRSSDGDSLDQRSPENFDPVDQPMHRSLLRKGKESVSEIQPEIQSERKTMDQVRFRSTLHALFNQESTKFRITMANEALLEESMSGLYSPSLKSPVHKLINRKTTKEKELPPLSLKTEHFLRKGQRHIAAMLTRSWKHQVRNIGEE